MLRGLVAPMEKHHKVRVTDEAIVAAVQFLASLYSGAAIARQGGEPARHRLRARRDQPERQARGDRGRARSRSPRSRARSAALVRERDLGAADEERIAEIDDEARRTARDALAALEAEWAQRARRWSRKSWRCATSSPSRRRSRQRRRGSDAASEAGRRAPRRSRPQSRGETCAPRSASSTRSIPRSA